MKKKALGSVIILILCVCFAVGAYFMKDKTVDGEKVGEPSIQNGEKYQPNQGDYPAEDNVTSLAIDVYKTPDRNAANDNQITEAHVSVKEDLIFVPWDFTVGLKWR